MRKAWTVAFLQAVQDGADTRQAVEDATGESKETVTLSLRRLGKAEEIESIGKGRALRYHACESNRSL